jgi:predicted RNA-binding protein with PIN domain
MPLLIDGHNLVGEMADLSLDDPDDELELTRRIRRYCWREDRRATVVFDAGLPGGQSHSLSSPEVEVVFASAGGSADAIILQRVRRERDRRGLLVVSSDRTVQQAVRELGAQVIPAEDFVIQLGSLEGDEEQEKLEPPGSVEEWLQAFGE